MAKNTESHDADYDRWGRTPGSIKMVKPAKKSRKPAAKSTGTRGKKK